MSLTRVAEVVVWWGLLVGVWVLTLSSAPPMELYIAAASALPCAVMAPIARRAIETAWRPDPRWLRWLAVLPVSVVVDTAALFGRTLARRLTGRPFEGELKPVPLRAHRDPLRSGAHRALATVALSATPGSFVIDTRPEEDALLVHSVVDVPPSLDRVVGE